MKILRFLFLLCIVFVICFLISGGHTLLDTSTIGARVEKQLPAIANNVEPTTLTGSRPVSTLDRLSRLLFLPKAVNRAISDRNSVGVAPPGTTDDPRRIGSGPCEAMSASVGGAARGGCRCRLRPPVGRRLPAPSAEGATCR